MNFILNSFIILVSMIFSFILGGFNFLSHDSVIMNKEIFIHNYTTKKYDFNYLNNSINGLKLINQYPIDVILDIRYASKNNFTKQVLYDADVCIIHEETLKKLLNANEEFKTLGYKLKIWDAYRPYYIQKKLWQVLPNNNYIANPYNGGSNHNKGCAVDVTLTDLNGNEIKMPSAFDEFSEKAHRNYLLASEEEIENSELLKKIMVKHGFKYIFTEWWHFDDINSSNYPIMNISLGEYLEIINNTTIKGGEI